MSGTANNSTCEISFNSEQLTQLIGPSNILLFDVVKDKIKEKNIELQKKRSHICYINTKLRRIEVEKEQLSATVTRVSEACSRLSQKNVILQAEVNVVTSDKAKISEQLSKSETAQQVLLNEKIWFEESNTELRSQITASSAEVSKLADEKEELARALAESVKLCEELRTRNSVLEVENEEFKEDNDYWRSENRELRTTSSIICDSCLNDV
jgi:chromosome segregation ATPase